MANFVTNRGKYLASIAHVSSSADFRLMLVTTDFMDTATADLNLVDDGTTDDPLSYELSVGGYARGTVAGLAAFEDDTVDQAGIDATDQTFSSLAAGETVGAAVLLIFSTSGGSLGTATTSDTGQELVAIYDVTDTATNGGDITIQWASTTAGGMLRFGSTS
jgi:hypothetical protein